MHNFVGRQKDLSMLHKMFTDLKSSMSSIANTICISGLGGIGKSALARKYAFTYKTSYDGNIIWINAGTVDSIRASFIRLAKYIKIQVDEKQSNQDLAARVYDNFKHQASLFIFDNLEEKSNFKEFQYKIVDPDHSVPQTLITSRRSDLIPIPENQLSLGLFSVEESVQLIQKQLKNAPTEHAEKLAAKLQRFPLALQQAIAYISDKYGNDEEGIPNYLKEFSKYESILLNDERFKDDHDYSFTTFTTWRVTLEHIKEAIGGHPAINIINTLSYLNPDQTSTKFLSGIFEWEIIPSLWILEKFSMITLQKGKVSIHRLVQSVIRLSLVSETECNILDAIVTAIKSQFDKNEYNDITREAVSHGLHLFPFLTTHFHKILPERSTSLSTLCHYLKEYGDYEACLSIAQESAGLYGAMYGEGSEDILRMKWMEADTLYYMRKYSEAMPILETILPVAQFELGQERVVTMNIRFSLARVHTKLENYDQAEQIYDEIIKVRVALRGEDPELLTYKQGKANILLRVGKLNEALDVYLNVYEQLKKVYGETDFRTLSTKLAIGNIARKKGEFKKALEIYREVHEGYNRVLGEKDARTIDAKKNVEETESELAHK